MQSSCIGGEQTTQFLVAPELWKSRPPFGGGASPQAALPAPEILTMGAVAIMVAHLVVMEFTV
jgi:hypothetical protein